MGIELLIPWTLATQIVQEVAGGAAGFYTLPLACNQVRVSYIGTKPTAEGALMVLPQIVGESLDPAAVGKAAFMVKNGESVEIANGTQIDRVSVFLGTGGDVGKAIIIGRWNKYGS